MELVLIEGGLVVTVSELNMKSPYKNLSWFDVGVLVGDKINFPALLRSSLIKSLKGGHSETTVHVLLEIGDYLAGCKISNKLEEV